MTHRARITDVQALADLRPAVIRFGEDAQTALVSAGGDAVKTLGWLQRERLPHWKREIRIRSEEAVRANTKLIQQNAGPSPRPSVDARKAYELAKRRVREAEDKYERARHWARALEQEINRYRVAVQPMASIARAHASAAAARLDAFISALDAYTSDALATTDSGSHTGTESEPADPRNDDPQEGQKS